MATSRSVVVTLRRDDTVPHKPERSWRFLTTEREEYIAA